VMAVTSHQHWAVAASRAFTRATTA